MSELHASERILLNKIKLRLGNPEYINIQTSPNKYDIFYRGRLLREGDPIAMTPTGDEDGARGVVASLNDQDGKSTYRVEQYDEQGEITDVQYWPR